jgi:capsular polysaccharide export protein
MVPTERRNHPLTLDALIFGALIAYPLYLSRTGDTLITPEDALDELIAWRTRSGKTVPWWRKCMRMLLRRIVGVR